MLKRGLMSMKRVIWWLIVGTKGGVNRARIIRALKKRPFNANQLTEVPDYADAHLESVFPLYVRLSPYVYSGVVCDITRFV
jgi:hypothetical protein